MPNISEKVVVLSELTDGISVVLSELTDNVDNINNELNNLNYYANYNKEFYEKQPLTFKSSVANAQVKFTKSSGVTGTLYYSYDNANWDTYTDGTFINLNNRIYFRGNLINDNGEEYGIGTFELSANTVIEGNIMSLIYNDNFINQTTIPYGWIFYTLFHDCTSLIDASNLILPATTLAECCYENMFSYCTSLVKAPELLAITLAEGCYDSMFYSCTSLIEAPEILPATALTEYCYDSMFSYCTSLIEAPELSATTLAECCYDSMFYSCTSLIEAPEILPATALTEYCYDNMFENCTSLTKAPELPATRLVLGCYQHMFYGCTNLNYIKALFLTTPSKPLNEPANYTHRWVYNVASTGIFIKSDDATWNIIDDYGIPVGWEIYTESEYNYVKGIDIKNVVKHSWIKDIVNKDTALDVNENGTTYSLRMWVDDFKKVEYDENDEAYIEDMRSEIADNRGYDGDWESYAMELASGIEDEDHYNGASAYEYTGETLEFDDETYYLWELSCTRGGYTVNDAQTSDYLRKKYLLTNTVNYMELYNISLENDPYTEICPYIAILSDDYDIYALPDQYNCDRLIRIETID